jgi:hypothetical protein
MVDSIEFDWILLRFVCVVLFERIFSVPTVYVVCTPFHHLSCVHIHVCVLPFVFNFPCRLYIAELSYFGLFPARERSSSCVEPSSAHR